MVMMGIILCEFLSFFSFLLNIYFALVVLSPPSHIHGHNFMIMGRAENYTSDDPKLNPPVAQNQTNPMRRDTVHVTAGGAVTLRFVADNPGAWFFHCEYTVLGLSIFHLFTENDVPSCY
jgi:hypothetical protein